MNFCLQFKKVILNYRNLSVQKINRFLRFFVSFYQMYLSPILGGNCRFYPSCSEYALDCLKNKSTLVSMKLIFIRLLKCHPFGSKGYDPVP